MTNKMCSVIKIGFGVVIPFLLIFAGCGPSHKEMMARDHLASAKAAYAQAKENPNVETNARIPLKDAGSAVEAASQAKEFDEMDHLAYLAERKTQIAVATAEEQMAENDKKTLSMETERLIAQGHEREQIAKMEARESNTEARKSNAAVRESNAVALSQAQDAQIAEMEARESNAEVWSQTQKAEKATARADNLQQQQEIAAMKGRMSERGIILPLNDVQFTAGAATLSSNTDSEINRLAVFLKKYPDRNVLIEGHTDNTGTKGGNLDLSLKRANAVSNKLVAQEIDRGRITTKGLGDEFPVAGNDTLAGRKQNRRVEVIILNEGVNP